MQALLFLWPPPSTSFPCDACPSAWCTGSPHPLRANLWKLYALHLTGDAQCAPPHTHTATLSGLLIYRKTSRDLDNPLIPLASAFIFQSVVLSCQEQRLNQCFTIWDWLSKAGFLRACLPTLHSQSSLGKQLCLHWREHSNETIKCFRSGHFRETRVISIRA